MRKSCPGYFIFCIILAFLIIFTTDSSVEAESTDLDEPQLSKSVEKNKALPFETEFTFSAGYRRDDLDWNIAGYSPLGDYVNILSELTWEDLESFQLKLQNKTVIPNINYDYQDWSTDDGTDKVFFSDGTAAKTRLNEVNWTSHALSLGFIYRF